MKNNRGMVEKLRNGECIYGLTNMYPASNIVKDMCSGWDFVWIDTQHGKHTYDSVLNALYAAESIGVDTVVRIYEKSSGIIGKFLDMEPTAVMYPMVNDEKQAKDIVEYSYNMPFGTRSYGACIYNGHMNAEERKPFVIAQIETMEAVDNCESIIALDGIDMLFVGAADLKLNLGMSLSQSELENDQTYKAMEKVAKTAKKYNKYSGCVMRDADGIKQVIQMGYQMISCGTDYNIIKNTSSELIKQFKE